MATARNYVVNSSLRAARLPNINRGLIGQDYLDMVESGKTDRFRNDKVPRNLSLNAPMNNGYDTYKITLPMGTLLFRAVGAPVTATLNLQKTRFHYFHPFPGLAVEGLSHSYSRFCIFALKYDTNFFLLVEPGTKTKRWVTHRDALGHPSQYAGGDNMFPKSLCRNAGVQGWIGVSGEDAHKHKRLAETYPQYFDKSVLMSDAHKFVHFDSWTRTQGFGGFPECVMWYEDLDYTGSNVKNKMVIEPIVCLHMPTNATEIERIDYIAGFYKKVQDEGLIKLQTTAKVSGGAKVPFAHFTLPQMSTKNLTRQYLSTPRSNLR
jgi:hypothetical protein